MTRSTGASTKFVSDGRVHEAVPVARRRPRAAARAAAVLAFAAAALGAVPAAAQFGLGNQPGGQPGGGLGGGGAKKKAAPKGPDGEETHAATSADDPNKFQTIEPNLPQNPLEVPAIVRDKIGTDVDFDSIPRGTKPLVERDWYGLYFRERSGQYQFKTIFPLWFERKQPKDRASLFGLYYNRRSPEHDADILLPVFGKVRDGDTQSTWILPFLHSEAPLTDKHPSRRDDWMVPFVFSGSSSDGSAYFNVPPLIAFTSHTSHDGFNLVGPLFCKWKGGPACDRRTADEMFMGMGPFYIYARDHATETEFIPPLLHYYHFNDIGDHSFNLWGPLLFEHSRETDVFNVMPVFWHSWGKNEDHLTIFPLFHYGYQGASNLLITPLFLLGNGDKGESTFVTYPFARYRGRTELDMWTPLFWWYRDPDIHLDRKLLVPFYYRNTSPRSDDLAVFPLFAKFHKEGLSDTTWVTPFFRRTTDVTGWETDFNPLFYAGRSNGNSHLIVAPILWDFSSPHSRATVVAPAYFRFSDETTVSQLALNTYYRERKVPGGYDWEVHIFPFFSYGESPTGHWWNFMYGLAGFTRDGTKTRMRTLWIPTDLSE